MPFPNMTPPPTAPDFNDPATVYARSNAFVAWWAVNNVEMVNWTALANALTGVTSTFLFTDGSAAAPSMSFAADTDTGWWRATANTMAASTGGLEAFRINSSQNMLIGATAALTGIGNVRLDIQGATNIAASVAVTANLASAVGPTFGGAKSRSATVGGYTILQAGDATINLEGNGADGAAMVIGARLRAVVEGTPASGDVRSGWRLFTGSGAGVLAEAFRLDINQQAFLPAAGAKLFIGGTAAGNQVLQGRVTGWTAATGTATRTSFATASVTTAALAQAVKALIDDLITHGLIGA